VSHQTHDLQLSVLPVSSVTLLFADELTLNRLSCSTFLIAISCSGASSRAAISSGSRLGDPLRTQHLGGKDNAKRSIANYLTVGVRDLNLLPGLALGRGDGNDAVWVIRCLSVSGKLRGSQSRAQLTGHLDTVNGADSSHVEEE
jgi:hypothetical protein